MNQQLTNLLNTTGVLLEHQEEVRKKKGEDFNIFSILKMERLEVRTHSAFIAELLSLKGSHHKGSQFLKLFLNECNVENFDLKSAVVTKEFPINLEGILDETNGRVDIVLRDKNNQTICIENKIDAKDQKAQLIKYNSYNKGNNRVFYLNLFGTSPSEESIGKLKSGEDFTIISYKKEIIDWLEQCKSQATDQSILHETIRQYIILLKKLTNTMDDNEGFQLKKLMLLNYKEAAYIAENFILVKEKIGEDARKAVIELLQKDLSQEFNIYPGNNTAYFYSQIWIKFKQFDSAKQFFGLESFSHKSDGELDIGIFSVGGQPISYVHPSKRGETHYWPYYLTLEPFEGYTTNFNNEQTLLKLYTDKEFNLRFIAYIVNEVKKFIESHKASLLSFLNSQTVSG